MSRNVHSIFLNSFYLNENVEKALFEIFNDNTTQGSERKEFGHPRGLIRANCVGKQFRCCVARRL